MQNLLALQGLNDNVGLIVLISVILIVALIITVLILTYRVHKTIVSQRLNFSNMTTQDLETDNQFSNIIVGNRSLNDITIVEVGLINGNTNFPFTKVYKKKVGLDDNAKILIEQRSSLKLVLTPEEVKKVILFSDGKFKLGSLKAYIVDTTGNVFKKRIGKVKKMVKVELKKDKTAYLIEHPEASFWNRLTKKGVKTENVEEKTEVKKEVKVQAPKTEVKAENKTEVKTETKTQAQEKTITK